MQRKTECCAVCSTKLNGRKDQVFCGIDCKNKHHKLAKVQTASIQKIINKRIRRNYVILEGMFCYGTKEVIVHRNNLFDFGFDINAFLSKHKQKGKMRYRILEYTFYLIAGGKVVIERIKKRKQEIEGFVRRWVIEFPRTIRDRIVKRKDGLTRVFTRLNYFRGYDLSDKPIEFRP